MRLLLTTEEAASLRCQTGMLKTGRGQHRKYLPHAFTEQGVAMLSSVLRSRRAVLVNVEIMRAFVAVRREAGRYEALGRKLAELERSQKLQGEDIQMIFGRAPPAGSDHELGLPGRPPTDRLSARRRDSDQTERGLVKILDLVPVNGLREQLDMDALLMGDLKSILVESY